MTLSFQLDNSFVDRYRMLPEPFGFGILGALTFYRTYARQIDDGVLETWAETCKRVIEGMYSIQKDHCAMTGAPWNNDKAQASAREAYDGLFNLRWSPPGRGLFHMGAPSITERCMHEALMNCAFISTETIGAQKGSLFSWIMEMLMLGVGVGSDVRGAGKVTIVKPSSDTVRHYVIPDSREGWAESIRMLFDSYASNGQSPQISFDYSQIRAKGEPIKGFGGTASGYEPLKWMHDRMRIVLDGNHGSPITARSLADIINMIGCVVVAGNVRRSSEILLGTPGDLEFANLKNYDMHPERAEIGWASNNSILSNIGQDYTGYAQRILSNGEPGFVWLENASRYGRMNGEIARTDFANGVNPCFAPGTMIQTKFGAYPIESLVGKRAEVWDGDNWILIDNFRITGTNQETLKVVLANGAEIICTPYHKFYIKNTNSTSNAEWIAVEARNLTVGDIVLPSNAPESHGTKREPRAYMYGHTFGTISFGMIDTGITDEVMVAIAKSSLGDNVNNVDVTPENSFNVFADAVLSEATDILEYVSHNSVHIPADVFEWDKTSKEMFIAGLLDSTWRDTGEAQRMFVDSKEIASLLQMLMRSLGIESAILANSNDVHEIIITNNESFDKIKQTIPTILYDPSTVARYFVVTSPTTIRAIEQNGVLKNVYCCTVPTTHKITLACGVITGQCGEQLLEGSSPAGLGGELCTLVELYAPRHTNKYDFLRSIKFAYLYGKSVALMSDQIRHPGTKEIMMRNRRIGLSVTGITQLIARIGINETKQWLEAGYDYVSHYDRRYSAWFGIPESIRKTTVKPSGSVSLLAGVTPGVHFPHSEYYIRRVRLSKDSYLVDRMQAAGYYIEDDLYSANTSVVSIPIFSGRNMRSAKTVNMNEQLALAAFMQKYWSDNSVSITVSVNPERYNEQDVAASLSLYQYQLKTVSMLPEIDGGAYQQMPYEEIDNAVYDNMMSVIDNNKLGALNITKAVSGNQMSDRYCDGDACAI